MKNLIRLILPLIFSSLFLLPSAHADEEEIPSLFKKRAYFSPTVSYVVADTDRSADNGWGGQLAWGYLFGNNLAVELEFNGDILDFNSGGINAGGSYDQAGVGLNGVLRFPMQSQLVEPFLLAAGGMLSTNTPTEYSKNVYLAAGLGVFTPIAKDKVFRLDIRYRTDTDDQSLPSQDPFNDIIVSASLMFPFGDKLNPPKDDDQDGVFNKDDRCPNTETGVKVDAFGCALDDDKDGVINEKDRCPTTPVGATVDIFGCEIDSDADSVVDHRDRCPNTPAGASVDVMGCELDDDKDGINNRVDECPNSPVGARVNAVGCELDDDTDGIVNSKDRCPNTPKGVKVDEVGCKLEEVITLQGIQFQFNSTNLANADQNQELQNIASTLQRYPDMRVLIVGHTDSKGAANYNLRLSVERANAIRMHLIGKGVNSENLSTAGKGESEPVADNSTETGRATNRRVELHIIDN